MKCLYSQYIRATSEVEYCILLVPIGASWFLQTFLDMVSTYFKGESPLFFDQLRGNFVTDVPDAIQPQVLQVVSGTPTLAKPTSAMPTSAMPTSGKPSVVASGRRAMALGRRPAKVAPLEGRRRKGRQRQQGDSAPKRSPKCFMDGFTLPGLIGRGCLSVVRCFSASEKKVSASHPLGRKLMNNVPPWQASQFEEDCFEDCGRFKT